MRRDGPDGAESDFKSSCPRLILKAKRGYGLDAAFLPLTSALGCFQKRRSDGRRDVYRHEPVGGEQVVLAALVDDPKVAVALGAFVRHDGVDLVALEGRLVPVVADADNEPARRSGPAVPSRGSSCA